MSESRADRLGRAGLLSPLLESMDNEEISELMYDWTFWQRPEQALPSGDWTSWMIRAGRGFGKTRTGAESIRHFAHNSKTGLIGAVAPTSGDARDVMVEGESGILATSPPWDRPVYEPSKRRVTWPSTGARLTLFSGEEPDRLRGPQHEVIWLDEPASMDSGADVVDMARLGLRLGDPKLIITGTPKRRQWMKDIEAESGTVVTTGSTYDNLGNLAPVFLDVILSRYEGTRLGRQELHAEYLDDVEGALWTLDSIESNRIVADDWDASRPHDSHLTWLSLGEVVDLSKPQRRRAWRTIIAVDPPGETAECGIVAAQAPERAKWGVDPVVVLGDHSMSGRPEDWGRAVVNAYNFHDAAAVYVEKNQGGDMVRSTIHAIDPSVPVKKINATESKKARAEPVSVLYGKGLVHHIGPLPKLESQMTEWVPDESRSPDRLDALVHAVRTLIPERVIAKSRVGSSVVNARI